MLGDDRAKPTLTGYTIHVKYLSNLGTFFEWAEANNLIASNPTLKVRVKDSKSGLSGGAPMITP
ncbi:MAG: hypothetical protein HZA67_06445 [Rhodospirillales bacterium]|jgi:hypothetical protein|nr:hypothetical protein [Rhodospirillales bacterium]